MHETVHHPDIDHHFVVEPHIEFTPVHHDLIEHIVGEDVPYHAQKYPYHEDIHH